VTQAIAAGQEFDPTNGTIVTVVPPDEVATWAAANEPANASSVATTETTAVEGNQTTVYISPDSNQ
jgi:hypothetical protein